MADITATCRVSGQSFVITEEDQRFYEKMGVPLPTLCPEERMRRRIAYRNERKLYKRKCSATGKDIVSIHSEDKPYPVYENLYWWGDKWDPLEYGQDFDFTKPFFEQFNELMRKVPQIAIMNDNGVQSENCEYTQDFSLGKNCYLITGSWHIRDSYYGDTICHGADVVDSTFVYNSELLYECIYSDKLYSCLFLQNCENCQRCVFGIDLKGCSDCFGCFGLRQKKFHIFNEPYSENEYKEKIKQFHLSSFTELKKMKQDFKEWVQKFPKKNVYQKNCENCIGDNLFNCKNSYGFDLFNSENSKFFTRSDKSLYCYDIHQSGNPEWCYECMTPDNSYMTVFSLWCWKDRFVFYSDNCHSSNNLFGCIGLKHAKYCILNKQYTKEEYETLLPKIIEHMKSIGEYGEFFPISISPFAYNETIAQEYFPLTKEEAVSKRYKWKDEDPKEYQKQTYSIPDNIQDVSNDICNQTLACEVTGKNYRIIPQELEFYRKMNLPIPRRCPEERHLDRVKLRNPRHLWDRTCAKCGISIKTTYSPERPDIIYCESCYNNYIYQ